MNLQEYLQSSSEIVEKDLKEYFAQDLPSPQLRESMTYSLFAGGKRVRPALAFAACEAVGGDRENAIPVASSLEMIHTYSLIHDDLPAMDNDDLRRGKPTNHKVYGDAVAILAGDGLLTEAFRRLSAPAWRISDSQKIEIVATIAEGAGALGMVAGQALDLHFEGADVKDDTLRKIHTNKTGQLLRASVLAGGIAGGANEEQKQLLNEYGKNIGLAFQIADDLLDVTASTSDLGKATGKDRNKQKVTFPSLIGVEKSREEAAHLLEKAIVSLQAFDNCGETLRGLARFIIERRV